MPAIDFPASPSINDEYSFEGRTWRWNGTGWEVKEYPAALLAGTAANPSLYFSGDTNTGLYSPGADQVAISTGGTGRLFVDASGRVGINDAPTLYNFDVYRAGVTSNTYDGIRALRSGLRGQWTLYSSGGGGSPTVVAVDTISNVPSIQFCTSIDGTTATERLRIASDGKVGVGTSSPGSTLYVAASGAGTKGGEIIIKNSSSRQTGNYSQLGFAPNSDYSSAVTGAFIRAIDTAGTVSNPCDLVFGAGEGGSPAERLRITSDGNVGIGTSDPTTILQSSLSGSSAGLVVDKSAPTIVLNDSNGTTGASYWGQIDTATYFYNKASGFLALGTNNAERLRITSDGKVGIGTSSPQGNLHIIGSSATPGVGNINISNAAFPTSGWAFRIPDSGSVIDLSLDGAIGGVWRSVMYFDRSAGNVGIGTSSPGYLLDVNGQVKITTNSINDSYFGFGANFDNYFTCGASGEQIFRSYNAERARIDSSGRLLVGTSTARTNFSEITTIDGNVALVNDDTYSTSLTRGIAYYSSTSSFGIQPIANIYFATEGDAQSSLRFHTRSSPGDYAERVRIDSSGRLLVGTSTSQGKFYNSASGVDHNLQIETTTAYAQSWVSHGTSASFGAHLTVGRSRGTSAGSVTVVQADDALGHFSFQGADGTEFVEAARIQAYVDGTPAANDMPGRLVFFTSADGAASPTEAMRINNQRELLIGTTTRTANGGVLQISNGITFPGTQSACSDANTLDDYEEGTWTPTVGGTATYTTQYGKYTKIGDTVFVQCKLIINILGTGSASTISGLPFNPSTSGSLFGISIGYFESLALTPVMINGQLSASAITFSGLTAANASITGTFNILGNSARVDFTATYNV